MKRTPHPLAWILSLALLGAAGAGIVAAQGGGAPVVRGAVLGLLCGWAGTILEGRLVLAHLATDFPRALRIVSAGFGLRALGILVGMLVLDSGAWASGSAFALGVVGGFFAFFPLGASALRSRAAAAGAGA